MALSFSLMGFTLKESKPDNQVQVQEVKVTPSLMLKLLEESKTLVQALAEVDTDKIIQIIYDFNYILLYMLVYKKNYLLLV